MDTNKSSSSVFIGVHSRFCNSVSVFFGAVELDPRLTRAAPGSVRVLNHEWTRIDTNKSSSLGFIAVHSRFCNSVSVFFGAVELDPRLTRAAPGSVRVLNHEWTRIDTNKSSSLVFIGVHSRFCNSVSVSFGAVELDPRLTRAALGSVRVVNQE